MQGRGAAAGPDAQFYDLLARAYKQLPSTRPPFGSLDPERCWRMHCNFRFIVPRRGRPTLHASDATAHFGAADFVRAAEQHFGLKLSARSQGGGEIWYSVRYTLDNIWELRLVCAAEGHERYNVRHALGKLCSGVKYDAGRAGGLLVYWGVALSSGTFARI